MVITERLELPTLSLGRTSSIQLSYVTICIGGVMAESNPWTSRPPTVFETVLTSPVRHALLIVSTRIHRTCNSAYVARCRAKSHPHRSRVSVKRQLSLSRLTISNSKVFIIRRSYTISQLMSTKKIKGGSLFRWPPLVLRRDVVPSSANTPFITPREGTAHR